jgi:hypothetical protein
MVAIARGLKAVVDKEHVRMLDHQDLQRC